MFWNLCFQVDNRIPSIFIKKWCTIFIKAPELCNIFLKTNQLILLRAYSGNSVINMKTNVSKCTLQWNQYGQHGPGSIPRRHKVCAQKEIMNLNTFICLSTWLVEDWKFEIFTIVPVFFIHIDFLNVFFCLFL